MNSCAGVLESGVLEYHSSIPAVAGFRSAQHSIIIYDFLTAIWYPVQRPAPLSGYSTHTTGIT